VGGFRTPKTPIWGGYRGEGGGIYCYGGHIPTITGVLVINNLPTPPCS